jgi:predicted DCC family thiol-disulfide oxidoreductase YuxK
MPDAERGLMLDVIYDGRCGFCVRALNVCRALDVRSALRYHDGTARQQVRQVFPELVDADFENAMFVVAPDRRVSRGFFAFRRILWESPPMWLLLPLFYFPGSGVVGPRVYAWVARNRGRFDCESDVCELPPPGRGPLD